MSFNPNNPIEDTEYLFRAFHLLEWNHEESRPNSGVFISSSPISVDRDGLRTDEVIIASFRSRPNYELCGLVKHTAKIYRECDTEPIPDPLSENEFHALVNGNGIVGTKHKHGAKLCKKCEHVIMAEQINLDD